MKGNLALEEMMANCPSVHKMTYNFKVVRLKFKMTKSLDLGSEKALVHVSKLYF